MTVVVVKEECKMEGMLIICGIIILNYSWTISELIVAL